MGSNRFVSRLRRLLDNPDLLRVYLSGRFSQTYFRMKYALHSNRKQTDLLAYPVIWLRTPKCGSSSVLAALESANRVVDLIRNKDVELTETLLRRKILCIGAAGKQTFIDRYPSIWERSVKWAIVRDPYQRALSAWQYLDHLRQQPLAQVVADPPQKEKDPVGYHHFTHEFCEMLSWNGRVVCDHVIKFEYLDHELGTLMSRFGVEFHGLPKINQTPGGTTLRDSVLTTELRQRLQELFADDFRIFEYGL